jgi:hypothetical protein
LKTLLSFRLQRRNSYEKHQKISISAGFLLASTNVLAHPGHEAIGDILHVEYLFAAGLVGAIAFMAWNKIKQRNED